MKITFVLDDRLDKPDGVQQCVQILGSWLSRQGHEVHYIVGETQHKEFPNIHVAARNIPVKFNGNRLTIPLPTAKRRIRRLLADILPDVLDVQAPYSPFMGAKVINLAPAHVGVVGTFHVLPYHWTSRWGTRLLGVWLRKSIGRFHSLYAGSPASAEFASWSFRRPVGVLQHSIDVGHFRAAKLDTRSAGKLRIIFLGRLVPRKGALQLLQAIAALPTDLRDSIEVRIGGRGPLLSNLQKFVAQHHLANIVQFDGFISEADKPAYLAQADVAIFPSISGESFGISLLEPMAAGAGVVVGGDNPGYHSILGDWPETLVDARDTAAFAQKLLVLLSDEALRHKLHGSQQTAIAQYDIETIGPRWLEIYQAAIDAARRT